MPRTGSIECHSGFGRASEEGRVIHQRLQKLRMKEFLEYRAEVEIQERLQHQDRCFEISGRMDGFFDRKPARIEEIKSAFQIEDLARKLQADHPYVLQLKTYGYFHFLKTGELPDLVFQLVSTRNSKTLEINVPLDLLEYQKWLGRRLAVLSDEVSQTEKNRLRRRNAGKRLVFPFDTPRKIQPELIARIEKGLETNQRLLLQAPTGMGKTAGVLYPTLKEALSRGQRVVYITPKNSQHRVAEQAVEQFQERGTPIRCLTLTAKSKLCLKTEPLCHPDYCEYAKDHYTKIAKAGIGEQLAKKKKFLAKTFTALAKEHQCCPFELQFEAVPLADVVICDYNYVIGTRGSQGRVSTNTIGEVGKPSLIIDEAHNLPSRGMETFSPSLSSSFLAKLHDSASTLPSRFQHLFRELIDVAIQLLCQCSPQGSAKSSRITPPLAPFLEHDLKIRAYLSRYLESDAEIIAGDPVLRLASYWGDFTAAFNFVSEENRSEFFTTFQPHSTGGTVKITCCDASELLKPCFNLFEQVIAFSATLKPFEFYARLSGLASERLVTSEFPSPFDPRRRKVLLIPQVSTKFSERPHNSPKIAEVIQRIIPLKQGNYFVFLPSFSFLEQVRSVFIPPVGFEVRSQEREMNQRDILELIAHLTQAKSPTVVFAVQGGVFSEGIDYPGDAAIGAFIVGPPLPTFDLEREEMRKYYQQRYGAGFDYAYAFPAMAKAVQAAGRIIRSETDRGIIILLDGRFLQNTYSQSMPADWFHHSPQELVSDSILGDVRRFWASSD